MRIHRNSQPSISCDVLFETTFTSNATSPCPWAATMCLWGLLGPTNSQKFCCSPVGSNSLSIDLPNIQIQCSYGIIQTKSKIKVL
ncbi:hypothetical protein QL285_055130 [Trifolium repens]|nr:hypothetical protein QL285_055130 [Trifolium repens]